MMLSTPADVDRRKALGMHISECHSVDYPCSGFLGPYETYSCICWCHAEHGGAATSRASTPEAQSTSLATGQGSFWSK